MRAQTLKQIGRHTCFAPCLPDDTSSGPPAIMGVIRHGDFQVETRRVARSTRIASAIRRVDKKSMQTFAFLTRLRSCGLDGIDSDRGFLPASILEAQDAHEAARPGRTLAVAIEGSFDPSGVDHKPRL